MKQLATAVAAVAFAATLAHAKEEHVGRDAERGDPARWDQPADTPQKRYDTAMKEAAAARAEAVKECRATAAPKACEAEARRQYEFDVSRARAQLTRPQPE